MKSIEEVDQKFKKEFLETRASCVKAAEAFERLGFRSGITKEWSYSESNEYVVFEITSYKALSWILPKLASEFGAYRIYWIQQLGDSSEITVSYKFESVPENTLISFKAPASTFPIDKFSPGCKIEEAILTKFSVVCPNGKE